MKNAVIFGANSTIAKSVIYKLAEEGYNLYLLARNPEDLKDMKVDLQVRYKNTEIILDSFNALTDTDELLQQKLEAIYSRCNLIDLVLIAHGTLPVQEKCELDWNEAKTALQINGISVIEICHRVAIKMQQQKQGTIAVISSVAGLRGRQSNYIYGTAKSMLNTYLSGLRNKLFVSGVNVITIMPGFVDTKMTSGFKKGLLWASPEKVATDIMLAINKKKNYIYTPWFWKYIMLIIRSIPENVFKKLKL